MLKFTLLRGSKESVNISKNPFEKGEGYEEII
jgi:hypothetical protein